MAAKRPDGTTFDDNTVFYEHNVPPTTLTLVESDIKIAADETVEHVTGLNSRISYVFFPGIPPKPKPTYFGATDDSYWDNGETVTITGPFGDAPAQYLLLKGSHSNRVALFKELIYDSGK